MKSSGKVKFILFIDFLEVILFSQYLLYLLFPFSISSLVSISSFWAILDFAVLVLLPFLQKLFSILFKPFTVFVMSLVPQRMITFVFLWTVLVVYDLLNPTLCNSRITSHFQTVFLRDVTVCYSFSYENSPLLFDTTSMNNKISIIYKVRKNFIRYFSNCGYCG